MLFGRLVTNYRTQVRMIAILCSSGRLPRTHRHMVWFESPTKYLFAPFHYEQPRFQAGPIVARLMILLLTALQYVLAKTFRVRQDLRLTFSRVSSPKSASLLVDPRNKAT